MLRYTVNEVKSLKKLKIICLTLSMVMISVIFFACDNKNEPDSHSSTDTIAFVEGTSDENSNIEESSNVSIEDTISNANESSMSDVSSYEDFSFKELETDADYTQEELIAFLSDPYYIYSKVPFEKAHAVFANFDSITQYMDIVLEQVNFTNDFTSNEALVFSGMMATKDPYYYYQIVENFEDGYMYFYTYENDKKKLLERKELPVVLDIIDVHCNYMAMRWPTMCITSENAQMMLDYGSIFSIIERDICDPGCYWYSSEEKLLSVDFYITDQKRYIKLYEDYINQKLYYRYFEFADYNRGSSDNRLYDYEVTLSDDANINDYGLHLDESY